MYEIPQRKINNQNIPATFSFIEYEDKHLNVKFC